MLIHSSLSLLFLSPALALSSPKIPAQNATAFSLTYGSPLLGFESLTQYLTPAVGSNTFEHASDFQTAEDREVVRPNVDTFYSTAIFDLSEQDLVLTMPDVPSDQFVLVSFYDVFGNNFDNLGPGDELQAGQYILRPRAESPDGDDTELIGTNDQYPAQISAPGTFGVVLIRWLVTPGSDELIQGYQNGTSFSTVEKTGNCSTTLRLEDVDWATGNSFTSEEHVLELLAQIHPGNPPTVASDSDNVSSNLASAGIWDGDYHPQPDVNLTAANASALLSAATAYMSSQQTFNNGWFSVESELAGNFTTNYALRSAVGATAYLMITPPEAVYPQWSNSSSPSTNSGPMSLSPDESYIYTFSGKPPVSDLGFWSLTLYGADNYLIPNDLDVYAMGDRSNLTYSSGDLVYGSDEDDAFQILVQPADRTPPSNWTSNWLPAPSGGGEFFAMLRWYGAEEVLLDRSYEYPVVTKQAAIVA